MLDCQGHPLDFWLIGFSAPDLQSFVCSQKTAALVGGKEVTADDIVLLEDTPYPVYGVPSKETIEAIRLSATGRNDYRPRLRG
jgi:hypothetical protein